MDEQQDGINNFVDDHSSAIADAMQNHFGVPVSVSKSKTAYGKSHYVKPNFDLPESETPFVVRVSDHAAWVPRLHQVEHHVYPKKTDDPRKFIGESIEAATAYGKRRGLFPKDEFVPLSGKVVHPTFGEGTVLDSKPDVAKVDFGKNGVKNISARFLQPIHKADGGDVDVDGITAYHGSPHEFEQFDTSKIGTGEGAQAYGHGLYFAEQPEVARKYRSAMERTAHPKIGGEWLGDVHDRMMDAGEMEKARALELLLDKGDILAVRQHAHQFSPETMGWFEKSVAPHVTREGGRLYEVHINAHPHHMLDWDKPLSEQSEHVKNAIYSHSQFNNYVKKIMEKELPNMDGKTIQRLMLGYKADLIGSPKGANAAASNEFSNMGIHGIRYLDAGSRNAQGDPTHNYVVFDHNDVHIKRKYERGGAVDNDVIPHGDPKREQNLTKWHHGSHPDTKNPDGTPRVFYHGTSGNFSVFNPQHRRDSVRSIFLSYTPEFAQQFASEKDGPSTIMPVHVSIKNPFDYKNPVHVQKVLSDLVKNKDFRENFLGNEFNDFKKGLSEGHWHQVEDPWVQDAIQNHHDGFFAQGNGHRFLSVFDPTQIKSAIGNNGNFDPSNPDITKADGGDVWDDSRVRRSGEGGTETALDFIQNAPLYKQRMEAQAPQPAPVAAPLTEGKSMPVTAASPPAIVQPAQPVQQKQEAPQAQGQVGLYAVGTNDPNPDMTVQSAQRIIESSRAMGINPVFLLPNQAGNTQYAQNSRALQKYLDENSIQYQMPQYGDKDPLHMTPSWALGASKSYNAPFLAGDSNSVRLGIVGYGAKGDGKTLVHPESGAVLGRVGANSKAVADELERHLEWKRRNRTERNTGGPVNASKGQDTAGNFKKEHEKIHGIPVAIEVKEGHDRVKYEPNGSLKFKAKQYADYGAILGTKDADGMNTDVMVGPHKDSNKAYIIDQRKYSTGKFDEHKVMLGFNKRKKAIKAYTKSYADRHGKDRVQDVVKTNIAGLKKWLKHGDLKVAAAKDALINRALEVVSKKT